MTTYANGLIPLKELTPLSVGGHLRSDAAASFERWRAAAARADRILTITSAGDAYRNEAAQRRVFLQRYTPRATGRGPYGDVRWWDGRRYVRTNGPAAAVPGTSNHGRGVAIDVRDAGPFGGSFHEWLSATGPEHGWSNVEGRSVNEPWHWVYNPANDRHATSGGGQAATPKPAPPGLGELTTPLQEAIMAGPIRMKIGKSITLIDVSVGTDVGVPNGEYDQALERIKIPLEVVTERERDLIKDMCSRVRDQRNKEIAQNVKAAK